MSTVDISRFQFLAPEQRAELFGPQATDNLMRLAGRASGLALQFLTMRLLDPKQSKKFTAQDKIAIALSPRITVEKRTREKQAKLPAGPTQGALEGGDPIAAILQGERVQIAGPTSAPLETEDAEFRVKLSGQ